MKNRNLNRISVVQREARWKKFLRFGWGAVAALLLSLSPVFGGSQSPTASEQTAPEQDPQAQQPKPTPVPVSQKNGPIVTAPVPKTAAQGDQKPASTEGQQTSRMFWIIPNFAAVSANTVLPPLSTKEKYLLATEDSVDYSSFVWTGIISAQSMALKSYPEFHQGLKGYGRYYWRAFADQASGSFFTEAIVPSLMHEDPRYYTLGHGGFLHRTTYAVSRIFVTKTDHGRARFNTSELGGNALEAGLANLYYPAEERSFGNTAKNWATQLEAACLNNFFREFWPDIRRKFLRQR